MSVASEMLKIARQVQFDSDLHFIVSELEAIQKAARRGETMIEFDPLADLQKSELKARGFDVWWDNDSWKTVVSWTSAEP